MPDLQGQPTARAAGSDAAWIAAAAGAAALLWALATWFPTGFVLGLAVACGVALVVVTYRRPEFGIVALVGAAGLDVVGRVADIAGVTLTAYQAAVALVAGALIARVVRGRTEWAPTSADLPVLLLMAFAAAAVPAAVQPLVATVSWVSLASSVALLYLVVLAIDAPEKSVVVLWSLLLLVGAFGVLAIAERLGIWSIQPFYKAWSYGIRARVTFKDPNIFGSFLAGSLALTLPTALSTRGWFRRLVAAGCVVAGLLGLAFTFSRGAWVGFVVGFLVVLVFSRVSPAIKLAVVAGGVALVAIFVFRFVDPTFVQTKILDVTSNRSFLYRFYLGASGFRIFLDHPLGIGPGNWPYVFPIYRLAFVKVGLVESHTAFMTVLAETGIFGFIGFAWLLVRFFLGTFRVVLRTSAGSLQTLAVGSLAGGAAILTQSLTYSLETSKLLWFTLGLGMAAMRLYADSIEEEHS